MLSSGQRHRCAAMAIIPLLLAIAWGFVACVHRQMLCKVAADILHCFARPNLRSLLLSESTAIQVVQRESVDGEEYPSAAGLRAATLLLTVSPSEEAGGFMVREDTCLKGIHVDKSLAADGNSGEIDLFASPSADLLRGKLMTQVPRRRCVGAS